MKFEMNIFLKSVKKIQVDLYKEIPPCTNHNKAEET